jgi:hypothetical protein
MTRERRVGSGAPKGYRRTTRSCVGSFKWEASLQEVLREMFNVFAEWSATITRIPNYQTVQNIIFFESTLLFSLQSAFRIDLSEAQCSTRYLFFQREHYMFQYYWTDLFGSGFLGREPFVVQHYHLEPFRVSTIIQNYKVVLQMLQN